MDSNNENRINDQLEDITSPTINSILNEISSEVEPTSNSDQNNNGSGPSTIFGSSRDQNLLKEHGYQKTQYRAGSGERKKSLRVTLLRVLQMGLGFSIVFSSFNSTQNLMTRIHGSYGYRSLALLYSVFGFSNLFIPPVVIKIGAKLSMVIGAIFYVLYIISNIWFVPFFYYLASGLLGLGASLLWSGNGAYIVQVSEKEQLGLVSGVFWGMFQCNQIFGNLLAAIIINAGKSNSVLFTILTCVGAFGWVFLLFLPNTKKIQKKNDNADFESEKAKIKNFENKKSSSPSEREIESEGEKEKEEEKEKEKKKKKRQLEEKRKETNKTKVKAKAKGDSQPKTKSKLKENLMMTFRLFTEKRMKYLILIQIFSGITQTIYFGVVPSKIEKKWLSYVMAVFGGIDVLGGIINGKLSDNIGKWPIIIAASFANIAGGVIILFASKKRIWLYFLGQAFFGYSDSGFNTQIYSILGLLFNNDEESAFAMFKLVQSLSTAAVFYYGNYLGLFQNICILWAFLLAGLVFLFYLDFKIEKIDQKKRKKYKSIQV
ncbi:et translation product-related [Anaeramoeba flamelloides]|uniref:UNC93-like protein MFSD11 n=1 Tax=Anaeramoeba flamelloides TaxID=1746091 RepID=A0AAV7YYV0_9EUKA|nr:et translation product-related [Anaeramoeba flamelloides]